MAATSEGRTNGTPWDGSIPDKHVGATGVLGERRPDSGRALSATVDLPLPRLFVGDQQQDNDPGFRAARPHKSWLQHAPDIVVHLTWR